MKERDKKFIKDIVDMLLTKGVVFTIGLIFSILVARLLTVTDKGIYEVTVTMYTIGLQVSNLGLHSSLTYYLANDKKLLPKAWGVSLIVSFFWGIVCLLLLISNYYWSWWEKLNLDEVSITIVAIMLPLQLFYLFQYQIYLSLDNIKICNAFELEKYFFPLLFLFIINIFYKVDNIIILEINILGMIVLNLLNFSYMIKKYKIWPDFDLIFLKQLIPLGFKSYIVCILAYLMLRIDIFMLNDKLQESSVGIYSVAVNIVDVILVIPVIIAQLFYFRILKIKSKKQRQKETIDMFIKVAFLLIGVEGIAGILAPVIFPIIYGERYYESIKLFQILLFGAFFWGMDSIIRNYFSTFMIYKYSIFGILIAVIINIVLNNFLILQIGVMGAAVSSVISYFCCFLVSIVMFLLDILFCNRINNIQEN